MKEWAIKAGLIDDKIKDQCKIVYEPDCASLAIQHEVKNKNFTANACNPTEDSEEEEEEEIKEGLNEDYKEIPDFFHKGEKYILVDAGGGTVDIACHEILGEFGVKEIHHPTGGPWGSYYIDDKYIELLEDIFSKEWMTEFKMQSPNTYVQILHNFQSSKATFYENYLNKKSKKHNVRIPDDFLAFVEEKCANSGSGEEDKFPEDIVAEYVYLGKSGMVVLNEEYLEINEVIWKEFMFDVVINPTIKCIKELLNEAIVMRNCKQLCLVGGLSCSKYFQYRMENTFGPISKYRLQIIIPKRPILSVVQGAAYFGITKNYIKARRLRKTYGISGNIPIDTAKSLGIPEDYIKKNTYKNGMDQEIVRDCVMTLAVKNEEIITNQIIERGAMVRLQPSKEKIISAKVLSMIRSDKQDPKSLNECDNLADVKFTFEKKPEEINKLCEKPITIQFHFYGTMIKGTVIREDVDNQEHNVEFEYQ